MDCCLATYSQNSNISLTMGRHGRLKPVAVHMQMWHSRCVRFTLEKLLAGRWVRRDPGVWQGAANLTVRTHGQSGEQSGESEHHSGATRRTSLARANLTGCHSLHTTQWALGRLLQAGLLLRALAGRGLVAPPHTVPAVTSLQHRPREQPLHCFCPSELALMSCSASTQRWDRTGEVPPEPRPQPMSSAPSCTVLS